MYCMAAQLKSPLNVKLCRILTIKSQKKRKTMHGIVPVANGKKVLKPRKITASRLYSGYKENIAEFWSLIRTG